MQQINLYQPILRKQKKVFSASTLLIGNLVILVGLLLLYGYTLMQTQGLQAQHDQATAQRNERQTRLQTLTQQYPARQADSRLPAQLDAARERIRQQQTVYRAISRDDNIPENRFSNQLLGLAQQVQTGLWLTEIQLASGHIRLQGQTRDAEQVPRLVQALSREAAFTGVSFQEVAISRDEEGPLLNFIMSTRHSTQAAGITRSGVRQ